MRYAYSMRCLSKVFVLLFVLAEPGLASDQKTTTVGKGYVVEINGPIGPAVSDHVVKAITRAREENVPVLILRMDTPGGLDAAMRDMIKAILNSPVPVIGFVAPPGARAASAGTYLLYATHIAAMAPSTNLGAATPIPVGGPAPPTPPRPDREPAKERPPAAEPSDAAQRKIINDAVAYIRSLAETRGRNADWAEDAVRHGASLSAEQALKQNVIDLLASDLQDLLVKIDGKSVALSGSEDSMILSTAGLDLEILEPDWRTRLLAIITNPTVAYILMMIGIYGLILEGYNPGGLVPGVIGAICLLLALFAFQVLPVNYAGLALIVLGLVLMMIEFFSPSFGVLGMGGLAAFVFGSVILMDSDVPGYQVPVALIGAIATASGAAMLATVYLLMKSRQHAVVTGSEAVIGAHAEAAEAFTGSGQVWLAGELWHAHCDQPLNKGDRVSVVRREGLTVFVVPEG